MIELLSKGKGGVLSSEKTVDLRHKLVGEMQKVFGEDSRRIEHAMHVLHYAERILAGEKASADVVTAAAILHDIGIHAAEAKYKSAAGHYQEIEGPPIAEEILSALGADREFISHVCRIIANHHSARDIDTPEFRIVWDADWMVNLPCEYDLADKAGLETAIDRIFKTNTGKVLAADIFLEREVTQ